MARDLDEILTHVDKLNELETKHVEPMARYSSKPVPLHRSETTSR